MYQRIRTRGLNGLLSLLTTLLLFTSTVYAATQECLNHQKDGSWNLVGVQPQPIRSLDDLVDGVYSVELANTRTSCGKGQGAV